MVDYCEADDVKVFFAEVVNIFRNDEVSFSSHGISEDLTIFLACPEELFSAVSRWRQ